MPSIVKKLALADLTETFSSGDSALIVSFEGLDMPENEGLRSALAESGVALRVVPNKLARRAFEAAGFEFSSEVFRGNVAVTIGTAEDTIHAAKVVTKPEVKKAGKVRVLAGALEKSVLGAEDAAALAEVPDQDTLRAKLLGCIAGPAQQLVGIVHAPGSSLARVLQAKVDAAEDAG